MSTADRSTPATPRRAFLGQLATGAVALAGTACATGAPAAQLAAAPAPGAAPGAAPAPSPVVPPAAPGKPQWNDAWVSRITGKHKAVFDAPDMADGTIVSNAYVYLMGYGEVYGLKDSDLSAVLVIRHAAIPMAFDDEAWDKYELGKMAKLKDPTTNKWARRNLYYKAAPGDPSTAAFTLDALRQRGAIILGCALAANRFAGRVATRVKQDAQTVRADLREHLVSGLELAPSGVFAVMRAQEAGCTYMRST